MSAQQRFASPSSMRVVYRRTTHGQKELVSPSGMLGADDRRLLGVLTGYTDLDTLLTLIQPEAEAEAIVENLLRRGLMEPVDEVALSA